MKSTLLIGLGVLSLATHSVADDVSEHALEANKEAVRQAEAVINAHDLAAIRGAYAEDYVRHSEATPEAPEADLDTFMTMVEGWFSTFPDARQETTMMVAEGDLVGFWGTFYGTQDGRWGRSRPPARK